jgi:hypothetical protein
MKLSLLNRNSWKKKYRIGIVYFADGSIVNKVAAWRLYLQIYRSRIVTTIGAYNLSRINHKLTSEDKKFISKHRNNRGYGYWLWKPLIILDFLEKNKNLDFIIYLDVGCEFIANKNSLETLSKYLIKAKSNDFVAFSTEVERYWSKQALIRYLKLERQLIDSPQIQSGIIIFDAKIVEKICEKWIEIMRYNNYQLLKDVPKSKIVQEDKEFKEHRHDQSIFSIIAKKSASGYVYKNIDETYFPGNWKKNLDKPFFAARNLRFTSILKHSNFSAVYITENLALISIKYFRKFIQVKK